MSPASRESSSTALLVLVAALSSASWSSRPVSCAFTLSLLSFSCWQLALSSVPPPPEKPNYPFFRRMSPASRESSRIALLMLVAALSSASWSSRLVSCDFTLSLPSFSCWQLALSSAPPPPENPN